MCDCLEEIEELKAKVKKEAAWSNYWMRLCDSKRDTISELRAEINNTKAELLGVRADQADTTATLDRYRDMHVMMSRTNSGLRKSASDLEGIIRTLTEERDLSRELFQGMVSEYADLLDRYAKLCDDAGRP